MTDTNYAKTLDEVQQNARATAEAFHALRNALAQRTEFAPLTKRARERAEELAANKFQIMVLGEFNRGKSTVLNALLGARVLPMKLTPCTAIITYVRHGRQPEALIAFGGDRRPNPDRLSLEQFNDKYQLKVDETKLHGGDIRRAADQEITDRFGPVDHAIIHYPSSFLENGVEFVDTPGLNEHDDRTKRVLEKLKDAAAIIMVLDAYQGCNQNEMNFIEEHMRPLGLNKHVFFVITRWDQVKNSVLNPSDPREVEEAFSEQTRFINSRLVPIVGAAGADKVDKRIFKVNARGALQHRLNVLGAPELETTEIPAFERALREFLTIDRDAARRDADLRVAEKIEKEVTSDINMDIRKARIPIVNFDQEQAKLDAQLEQLNRIKINIESILRASAAEAAKSQSEGLKTYLTEKLFGQLKEHVDGFNMGPLESVWTQYKIIGDVFREEDNKVTKQIERHLQHEVATLVGKHINEWRSQFQEPEMRCRTGELIEQLKHEAGEYIQVLSEIRGDERHSHEVSPEEINKKIVEWVQSNRSVIMPVGGGVVVDLGSALATAIIAEAVLHLKIASTMIGIPVAVLLALFRAERAKDKAREKIVKALARDKEMLLMKQKENAREEVEGAFKSISEPISQSIGSEIAIIKASVDDVLEKRRNADFDANAFEQEARAFEADISRQVSEIRRLVT